MSVDRKESYFQVYGGLNEVVKSPYFYGALLTTLVASRYLLEPGWWDLVISAVPGLVGFSIAGVAIFISLGNDSLRSVFAGRDPGETAHSPFMKFMAMFTHFIVIQLAAFILAYLAKAIYESPAFPIPEIVDLVDSGRYVFWFIGGLAFSYAVFLSMALALEIYRLARMIDEFQTAENEPSPESRPEAGAAARSP